MSMEDKVMGRHSGHYNEKYFSWQMSVGEFGGWANRDKFAGYIRPEFSVLDFGCGGGYLLRGIDCKEKVGIEVNPAAREKAASLGIRVHETVDQVEDNWADLIISNNALEHTLHPLQELKGLYPKLKTGGKVVFIVPCESIGFRYRPDDVNHHLYSWSPMCIGNLFTEAGYRVDKVEPYIHKWPPYYRIVARLCGARLFHLVCRLYGHLERSWFQVRIVAAKT